MDLSDRMKNDIKDTKTAFDESQNVLTGKIEDMAKKQEASNLSYKSDLDTFKKSYNDTLTTLNSFNSSFVTYQNDLMSMKQNMDTLNSKQDSLTKEIASLNTEFNNKINVLLNEIVNQESEIFILQTKLTDLSGTKTQSKNKIYIVKKGDTILKISNKFNVPVDKLKKANKLKRGTVSEGQKLIIP
jgi:LysM repeat protein